MTIVLVGLSTDMALIVMLFFLTIGDVIGFLAQYGKRNRNVNISPPRFISYSVMVGISMGLFGYVGNILVNRTRYMSIFGNTR